MRVPHFVLALLTAGLAGCDPGTSSGQARKDAGIALPFAPAAVAIHAAVGEGTAPAAGAAQPAAVRYGRDIRPILSDRCFQCHGPDDAARQAGLRLDLRDSAVGTDGRGAIVPGRPDESELLRRVLSHDPQEVMPPPSGNKRPISSTEAELLRRWIADGAEYEPHWAFVPPRRPAVPAPAQPHRLQNAIDAFVLARLDAAGVEPSPPAPPETQLRRLFLDLTGLPPTPEELDEFLAAAHAQPVGAGASVANSGGSAIAAGVYERWVDRLLTTEPYRTRMAERLALPWLDAARYADTCGIHTDAGRQMWAWRDELLRSLRDNQPLDEFIIDQLAGDLRPDATDAQRVRSGFHRNHVTTDEGGAIAEEYLVEYAVDRTDTTGAVFLGLTLGCARCHDHKYDPISQQDYYRLFAFFNSIDEPGLYSQLSDPNRAFEPFMAVPTAEQKVRRAELVAEQAAAIEALAADSPGESAARQAFARQIAIDAGVEWVATRIERAESSGGATLTVLDDGSVLAGGENPARDDHTFTLRTESRDLRWLVIEALPDASLPGGRLGRAFNGNAVLSGVEISAASVTNPSEQVTLKPAWVWADFEQFNGDFRAVNVLNTDALGWAVDAHNRTDSRVALLLVDRPFGFPGGTDVRVTLQYRSVYDQHTFGRVRLRLGTLAEPALAMLPAVASGWYRTGPFPTDRGAGFAAEFGPEDDAAIDLARNFGNGNQVWQFDENLRDSQPNPLADGTNVSYVGRRIFSPTDRTADWLLGSDDGFQLFVNGALVAERDVERGVVADQDHVRVSLRAGMNSVVFKIINTGGQAGFYFHEEPRDSELTGDLVAALLPTDALPEPLQQRVAQAWKIRHSPGYREKQALRMRVEEQIRELDACTPLTMVMKELPEPRETFVLSRGEYDKPDRTRPVSRGVPTALGSLPDGAPLDRLGLARWMVGRENPLVARVMVNRLWEQFFGTGIVRTSEDFGLQGEWPSHPELLDWLAIELQESGWNLQHVVRLIVSSATYRQTSRVRPELLEMDRDNRLLAWYPRRRLPAEALRDQALYVSGLLVEQLGGPSVKPYQPEGLWQEVAMPQSNTRNYERGQGDALWRRSLYTYWKRASPPPALLTLDAPTRESCTIRRAQTNTPLQALVLWNDEQFVEAARGLAQRVLTEPGDDSTRLAALFRRCVGRAPDLFEHERLAAALAAFLERYRAAPDDAAALLRLGASPVPENFDRGQLAAWTMVASSVLNLSATVSQR